MRKTFKDPKVDLHALGWDNWLNIVDTPILPKLTSKFNASLIIKSTNKLVSLLLEKLISKK